MSMNEPGLYDEREQTLVKHFILQKYLERFALKVGSFAESITYVDCFSGPWNVRSEKLEDSSFSIALGELLRARQTLSQQQRDLKLRCFFLEKDRTAYSKLKEFADRATDAEIETRNSDLEGAVSDIVAFVRKGGRKTFPFVFIDPTGWSGLAMKLIAPLLQLDPGEVLINFMTGHIGRFIGSPDPTTQDSFDLFYGSGEHKAKLLGLVGRDREEAAVQLYADIVKRTGKFPYTCTAIVLHPQIDRTHFHLIYATRNMKGVAVFKEVEKKAMQVMEKARADAQQRTRVKKSQTLELFDSEVRYGSTLYNELRERYLNQANRQVQKMIQARNHVPYDEVWISALSLPLVWECDLKEWIDDWKQNGDLQVEGMAPRQRVPRLKQNNVLVWIGPPNPEARDDA